MTNKTNKNAIHINITIHKGGHCIVDKYYGSKPLFEGPREYCMNRIRKIIEDLSTVGGGHIIFHVEVWIAGDINGMYDRSYFKSHLGALNNTSRFNIEIAPGLYGYNSQK